VGRRPASASLAFKGGATAVAFDVYLEDGGVMNEAVASFFQGRPPDLSWLNAGVSPSAHPL
jgi:hypothetical protein